MLRSFSAQCLFGPRLVRVPPGAWRGYEAGPEGLEAMVRKLAESDGAPAASGRRSTRRRSTRTTGGRRRGRPRGTGTRSAQALALVQAKPGITIPEMANEMGITPNYLYRVLPELAKDRKVKKVGKGWAPVP